jgi:hypothetical protein
MLAILCLFFDTHLEPAVYKVDDHLSEVVEEHLNAFAYQEEKV